MATIINPHLDPKTKIIIIAVLLLFVAWFLGRCTKQPKVITERLPSDTVYIPKPYPKIEIKIKERIKPYPVYIYLPDTARRKKLEKETIINSIQAKGNDLIIQTINPKGIIFENDYKLPDPMPPLKIDANGNMAIDKKQDRKEKRKIVWKKIKKTTTMVGVVLIAFVIGRGY